MGKLSRKNKKKVYKYRSVGATQSRPRDASQEGVGRNEKSINMLDENILETIFGFLGAADLIIMEKVCQKWKNVCDIIWHTKPSLKFHNFLDLDVYEQILSRCGAHITSLSYFVDQFFICSNCCNHNDRNLKKDFFVDYNNKIIAPIVKYCKNLKHLDLTGLNKVHKPVLKSLAHCSFFRNITSLVLSDFQLNDDILDIILSKTTNLHTLSVNSATTLRGYCLVKLPNEVTTLVISACCCLDQNVIKKILKLKLPNLEKFGACSITFLSLGMLESQIKLVELYVHETELFKDLSYDQIKNLSFPQLKILHLKESCYVTEFALSVMSVIFPNLEDLDLSECYSSSKELKQEISNASIGQLTKLQKLKFLKLNNLTKIDFDVIVSSANGNLFRQMKEFECSTVHGGISSSMSSSGISGILNMCPCLEILDLRGNAYITNLLLENAFRVVKPRKNPSTNIQVLVANEDPDLMANSPQGDFDDEGRLRRKVPPKKR